MSSPRARGDVGAGPGGRAGDRPMEAAADDGRPDAGGDVVGHREHGRARVEHAGRDLERVGAALGAIATASSSIAACPS